MIVGDFITVFETEIDRLGGRIDASMRDLLDCLGRQGSKEADAACLFFAAKREWPPLPPKVKLEICLRLACAAWYCRVEFGQDREDETEREFLESLLIEYWLDVGRADWLYEAFVRKDSTGVEFESKRPPDVSGPN